ncbi:ParB N-terminal domain-containing protein [Streptomyces sp. NBC_00075]|uniref:ParB/RepB/Spo0J family partition protein n=1 Tax=Streptomyces sp. NBC_00075 TaxID=2975641 RepID=UPI00324CEF4E
MANEEFVISSPNDSMPESAASRAEMETVSVALLLDGEVLRLKGTSKDHVYVLIESEELLPPILVHRGTMRVIDGMHRLAAAKLRGHETIQVQFFDGDPEEAFVKAVQANSAHGLPLTLADRKAAAHRILRSRTGWSDRRIASLVGLSPKTVGAIRGPSTEEFPQLTARVGRDGRVRRLPASDNVYETSTASVPAASGISSEPAISVNASQPSARSLGSTPLQGQGAMRSRPARPMQRRTTMELLRQDPSLRMTEAGRFLLRLLDLHLGRMEDWDRLIEHVPPHRMESVADLAWECAQTWVDFAQRVASQGDQEATGDT